MITGQLLIGRSPIRGGMDEPLGYEGCRFNAQSDHIAGGSQLYGSRPTGRGKTSLQGEGVSCFVLISPRQPAELVTSGLVSSVQLRSPERLLVLTKVRLPSSLRITSATGKLMFQELEKLCFCQADRTNRPILVPAVGARQRKKPACLHWGRRGHFFRTMSASRKASKNQGHHRHASSSRPRWSWMEGLRTEEGGCRRRPPSSIGSSRRQPVSLPHEPATRKTSLVIRFQAQLQAGMGKASNAISSEEV